MTRLLRSPWSELVFAALLGTGSGLAYRVHRAGEAAWSAAHQRLNEQSGLPASRALPLGPQFILGAGGERIDVPLPEGQELDLHGATWWSVDEAGRMRTWNEERVEVFPTLAARSSPYGRISVTSPGTSRTGSSSLRPPWSSTAQSAAVSGAE